MSVIKRPGAQPRDDAGNCLDLSCGSHQVRTYLVRAGLLARGMLLQGRIIAYNKMVAEVKQGKPVKDIHPATPTSEVQFWLMSDTTRHLETWFCLIFFELLSGLPVKSVEAVTYVVDPRSVLSAYHKFVQHDPTHRVYKITLATKQAKQAKQVWVLDPGGARMAFDEMLLPWKAFKQRQFRDPKSVVTIKPDIAKFENTMGICHHGPAARKEDGGKVKNFADDETLERRALRMWATSWTGLLPEVFGGSMANLGTMSHEVFSVAMDEFLVVFRAYVKTYLLDSDYYGVLLRDYANCVPWGSKMYNAHPAGGHDDEHECCRHCDCDCHEAFDKIVCDLDPGSAGRWDIRGLIPGVAGHKAEELSSKELLKTVQGILIDRAGQAVMSPTMAGFA